MEMVSDDILNFTFNGMLVELVTMPPCHGGGHGFESRTSRKTQLNYNAISSVIP